MTITSLNTQAAALASAERMAVAYPGLPGAYLTSHSIAPNEVHALVDCPSHFEAWREALDIPTDAVTVDHVDDRVTLEFSMLRDGVDWRVFCVSYLGAGGAG
ncbi:hypothetical protein [Streptomyces benahoarensis]|uniref:Uncharacterized protein n=1 Tax=Streptomyces benahoarensis TaxID=2595054 RepID=A0A553ZN57_9ACTN|nr:hypothetical protein [Streptomyces benahoarensis]TSB26116.1 hypothetical protein FNJ62_11555 [Streptomyces benahoarensis]TSB42890.1 hypothetical protein FNZ23_07420 [Streptomyces benahoarensis]